MPALFAYLIAVGLLLGGGYGALSWLAAPEPVKVASKAKPKPPPLYAASSEASFPEANLPAINDSDKAAPGSNRDKAAAASSDQQPPSASDASVAASGQGAQAQVSGLAPDQRTPSASPEVSSEEVKRYAVSPAEAKQEAKQEDRHPAQTVAAVSPGNSQAAASESSAAAKMVKRPHLRQASRRSDRRAPALMTLRTIEFPDGRRVTQLIPYRSGERALAFERDDEPR
jgi:hypothetical protein